MSTNKWNPRDYNVICDICGKKRKRSECTMAYGGGNIPVVMSCRDGCADKRQPLNDPPPIIFDGRPVRDARPEAVDTFVGPVNSIYFIGKLNPTWIVGSVHLPNNIFNLDGMWFIGQLPGNLTYIPT
jgi:hypothetical protein